MSERHWDFLLIYWTETWHFLLCFMFFVSQSRKYFLQNTKMLNHLIFSQVLMVLTFLFPYMINLDQSQNKFHLQCKTGISVFFLYFPYWYIHFSSTVYWKEFLSIITYLGTFVENPLITYVWVSLQIFYLFY